MIKLYEHQEKAVKFALKRSYSAFFMEMGTGKTIAALELCMRKNLDRILIVCPKPIMQTWEKEIENYIQVKHRILTWNSTKLKTKKYQYEISNFIQNVPFTRFFIVNIEAFSKSNPNLEKLISFFWPKMCILDESSKIKNHKAQRTKNLIETTKNIANKLILTGTEITNSVLDVYTQFRFLKSNFWPFRNFFCFRARYAILEEIYGAGGRTFKVVRGFKRVNELIEKIEPYFFRIKKKDCLDLPEKIYQKYYVEMNPDQKKVYEKMKNDLWAEYKGHEVTVQTKVSLFMRFRQITGGFMPESGEMIGKNLPKLDFILDETEDYPDKKIIIWCAFVKEIETIMAIMEVMKIGAVYYYGKMPQSEKDLAISLFRNNKHIKFFIANPASAAYGLNLQFSDLTYWYSRTLSIEQNLQAEDRQHRIGQKNNVIYKDILCKNTIDDRVYQLIKNKTDLIEKFQEMTIDDVFNLI